MNSESDNYEVTYCADDDEYRVNCEICDKFVKLSGHTEILTEASILIDELHKRGQIPNEQQYRNALDKFSTK